MLWVLVAVPATLILVLLFALSVSCPRTITDWLVS